LAPNEQAAGLNPVVPALPEVTAACPKSLPESLPHDAPVDERTPLDFAHLKRQLPIATVLDHLGLTPRLRGPGAQRRCACPIHRGDGRGRTFSVHLEQNVFQCFDAKCAAKGDVIDLWASVKKMPLRDAALDLVRTFHLEPAPRGTEKRNGCGTVRWIERSWQTDRLATPAPGQRARNRSTDRHHGDGA